GMRIVSTLLALGCAATMAGAADLPGSPMVEVPGGSYLRPLERGGNKRQVDPYLLDVRQVTNAEFLEFVISHPQWRRSNLNELFADSGYLAHWASDTE